MARGSRYKGNRSQQNRRGGSSTHSEQDGNHHAGPAKNTRPRQNSHQTQIIQPQIAQPLNPWAGAQNSHPLPNSQNVQNKSLSVPNSLPSSQQRPPRPARSFQRFKKPQPIYNNTASALSQLQDLTKEWNPRRNHGVQLFTKLPQDLAFCIMDFLEDPVDKVSFALTTKSLWEVMNGKLRLEQFNLPAILPPRVNTEQGVIKPWPCFDSLRWKLLERLEDNYWKCCAGCLRLQPKSEFWSTESIRRPVDRYCKAPGLIQLCPHLILTYKKCENLRKTLLKQTYRGENKFCASLAVTNKLLNHECKVVTGNTQITCTVQPFLSDKRKHLIFHQAWTVQNFEKSRMKETLEGLASNVPLLCPHRNILTQCLDMVEKGDWNPDMITGESNDLARADCVGCDTAFFRFKESVHSVTKKSKLEFYVHRHIGNGFGLESWKTGHAFPGHLQFWVDKTNLANVIKVDYATRPECKCRENCTRMYYQRVNFPSWKASLPDTRWKTGPNILS